jgi:hypothetical protein
MLQDSTEQNSSQGNRSWWLPAVGVALAAGGMLECSMSYCGDDHRSMYICQNSLKCTFKRDTIYCYSMMRLI